MKRPEDREEDEEQLLARISSDQPKIQKTVTLARDFAEMVRQ
jgi:hypothetical protein